jgi:hypothetical protein
MHRLSTHFKSQLLESEGSEKSYAHGLILNFGYTNQDPDPDPMGPRPDPFLGESGSGSENRLQEKADPNPDPKLRIQLFADPEPSGALPSMSCEGLSYYYHTY